MKNVLSYNGGRRSGIDRRRFSYTEHIPERRSGKERRSGFDRRLKPRMSNNLYSEQLEFSLKSVIRND